MSTGQMILIVGGLIIFGFFTLNTNRIYNQQYSDAFGTSAIVTASGLGQSMLEEIISRHYDETTISESVALPDLLTAAVGLGPDAGENSYIAYDDVDDYDAYFKTDTLSGFGAFDTRVAVNYVQYYDPETPVLASTFYKTIHVAVANAYLADTLRLYYVVTY